MRTLIVKSACRSQSAPTSRAIGQYPVYFFCKFFKTPNSSVDGVALFWKGGLATGVAGGQISAPLMRAGKDPASRAVAGWDWPAWGLGWRVGARPPWAGRCAWGWLAEARRLCPLGCAWQWAQWMRSGRACGRGWRTGVCGGVAAPRHGAARACGRSVKQCNFFRCAACGDGARLSFFGQCPPCFRVGLRTCSAQRDGRYSYESCYEPAFVFYPIPM